MDLGINGRIALVGGGSKGMGRAAAEALAREGARVVVVARGQEAIDATVEAIAQNGGTATGLSADLYGDAGVAAAVQHCKGTFGASPDIAIANVYGADRHTFESADAQVFQDGYDRIVKSTIHLARAVLPDMKLRGWGRLVTIGSFCAKKPHWHIPLIIDNVTRAAAIALSKSLSNEYGGHGITVNTIAPGFIATDMAVDWMQQMALEQGRDPEADSQALNAGIPVGRQGRPDEIGSACAFLCSDLASYITGQLLMVDGGLVGSTF